MQQYQTRALPKRMPDPREATDVRSKALAYLARREHTRAELEQKLLGKGYSRGEIERTLDRLEHESLLSHSRYISDYIRSAERKGYGPTRIYWDLRNRKGLDESEIRRLLSEASVDWVACARRCCEKKFGGVQVTDRAEWLKWQAYLFKRGFPREIACDALVVRSTAD